MENTENIQQEEIQEEAQDNLTITPEAVLYLKEIQKWTKFISIVGFVMVGFIFLMAISASALFSFINELTPELPDEAMVPMGAFPSILFFLVYGTIGIIYFFPIYYLFQFSSKLKASLKLSDEAKLTDAFKFLKSHYKFISILIIIGLVIYGITFLAWGLIILAIGMGTSI